MTSKITLTDAGGAATFSGASVASSHASVSQYPSSSHRRGSSAELSNHPSARSSASIQYYVIQDVIEAEVACQLLHHAPVCPAKIPDTKLDIFNGKQAKWVNFNHSLNAALGLSAFSSGSEHPITNPANKAASTRVRALLFVALEGTAANCFDR